MLQAVQLTAALQGCTRPYLPQKALQVEMQIAVILAQMEVDGIGRSCTTSHALSQLAATPFSKVLHPSANCAAQRQLWLVVL